MIDNLWSQERPVLWLVLSLMLTCAEAVSQTLTLGATFKEKLQLKSLDDYTEFEIFVLKNASCRLLESTHGSYQPSIASSWSVSSDGLRYIFQLRKDARYSDDTPVTSEHVAYTIKRHIYLKGQLTSKVRTTIQGADGLKSAWQEIEGIKAEGPFVLKITLTRPYPAILEDLSFLTMSIFKPSDLEENEDRIKPNFSSCGAYNIVSFEKSGIRLRLRKDHWKVRGLENLFPEVNIIDKYGLKAFEAGKIDSARGAFSDFIRVKKTRPGIKKVLISPIFRFLRINAQGPMIKQFPQLPRLLNAVIDRERLIHDLPHDPDATASTIVHYNIRSIAMKETSFFTQEETKTAKDQIRNIIVRQKIRGTLQLGTYRQDLLPILEKLKSQIEPLGVGVEVVLFPMRLVGDQEHMNRYDFVLLHGIFDNTNPGEFLPFLAGTSSRSNNLPRDHELFNFYNTLPSYYEKEDWTGAIMAFNELNRKYGFVLPLYISKIYGIFSEKVDVSNIDTLDENWSVDQLRVSRLQQ